MTLTIQRLKELIRTIEQRRAGFNCQVLRDGEPRFEPKPKTRFAEGHVFHNGDVLVKRDGVLGIMIGAGTHGRAFIGIDPATGEVRCAACAAAKGGA
jgi:hypothetical protein